MTIDNHTLTQRIQELLVDALQVPASDIPADLSFGDMPQWDSLGHMEVMMLLEERFGIELNDDTIRQMVSIPAIRDYIQEHHLE